jgi:hypothetical protein
MEKIFSKVEPGMLLHIINRLEDIEGRHDIAPAEEFLQLATIKLNAGQTFRAHKHIKCVKTTDIAQESWVVIRGQVKCILYDLDDTIIAEPVLKQGDCSMTFRGGHNYLILEDETLVYEYKTGPYFGQEFDKIFLNNNK